jgi:hypothetical protein
MGSIYLDFLDDAVKVAAEATGYSWKVYDSSWLHRARSSGGYDTLPLCVMWHHTAGADNAQGEADYMVKQADARPIANICVDSKIAIVMAGGATNTNGSGVNSPMTFSRGTVAKDDMNRRAVGIEICNNGVGATYPEKQMNFLFALSNEINRRCGNQPTDVCTHQHYAPDRKIDPAVAAAVQGVWKPRSVNSSGSWNVEDLRAECKRRWAGTAPGPTPPPTPTEEDDMVWRVAKWAEGNAYYIGDGNKSWHVPSEIDADEAACMMAPGAVNVVRCVWDKADDANSGPRMVTSWGQIKATCGTNALKKYVGVNPKIQ